MEFPMPVRIRWDVDFGKRRVRSIRIARAIREASPLVVELRVEGGRGLKSLPGILDEIYRAEVCVEATIRLSRDAVSAGRWRYPVGVVWEIDGTENFAGRLPEGAGIVAFTPDGESLSRLPDVLAEFSESAAPTLRLTNVDAVKSLARRGHVPTPEPRMLEETVRRIADSPPSLEGRSLVVHDVFLWKALRTVYPGETGGRVEFSGCQAGSALAYVDWEGNVYPCDALPLRLGNIADEPFGAIWSSPARQRMLDAIRALPPLCAGCAEAAYCLAGCRGLAHTRFGTFASPDPSCPNCGSPVFPPLNPGSPL